MVLDHSARSTHASPSNYRVLESPAPQSFKLRGTTSRNVGIALVSRAVDMTSKIEAAGIWELWRHNARYCSTSREDDNEYQAAIEGADSSKTQAIEQCSEMLVDHRELLRTQYALEDQVSVFDDSLKVQTVRLLKDIYEDFRSYGTPDADLLREFLDDQGKLYVQRWFAEYVDNSGRMLKGGRSMNTGDLMFGNTGKLKSLVDEFMKSRKPSVQQEDTTSGEVPPTDITRPRMRDGSSGPSEHFVTSPAALSDPSPVQSMGQGQMGDSNRLAPTDAASELSNGEALRANDKAAVMIPDYEAPPPRWPKKFRWLRKVFCC